MTSLYLLLLNLSRFLSTIKIGDDQWLIACVITSFDNVPLICLLISAFKACSFRCLSKLYRLLIKIIYNSICEHFTHILSFLNAFYLKKFFIISLTNITSIKLSATRMCSTKSDCIFLVHSFHNTIFTAVWSFIGFAVNIPQQNSFAITVHSTCILVIMAKK